MPLFSGFTSLFSSAPSASGAHGRKQSKSAAFVRSTDDAFALPTHDRPYGMDEPSRVSLGVGLQDGFGFGDSRPGSPALPSNALINRPDSPGPSNFTYPPRMPETGYNHVANPGQSSAGSFINDGRPRQASAWQGSSKLPPSALYPPLSHTWERVNNFLTNTYPELSDSLNFPSSLDVIDVLERTLNMRLPSSVRDSYLCADGQDIDGGATEGLFFGLALLPLEDVLREWQFWRQAEADPRTGGNPKLLKSMSSFPPKWVKKAYANRGWLPLISDRAGNYVGVDLDPGPMGEWGQVIVFGRDFDTKAVLWKGEGEGGWGRWLAAFADELEAGETWELDGSGRGTDSGSEDEIGYADYLGGDQYGDKSTGMRLVGEYRGWNILEAWWDRSVRLWDQAGMLKEPAPEPANDGLGFGDVTGEGKGKAREGKLIPESPDLANGEHSKFKHTVNFAEPLDASSNNNNYSSHRQLVSPIPSTNTIGNGEFLSPSGEGQPKKKSLASKVAGAAHHLHTPSLPAPVAAPLDLPTRSDVVASEAVHIAETQGLRGGWILGGQSGVGMEPYSDQAHPSVVVLDQGAEEGAESYSGRPSAGGRRGSSNAGGMVDVDLEGGLGEGFGRRSGEGADGGGGGGALSPGGTGRSAFNFLRRPSAEGRAPTPAPMSRHNSNTLLPIASPTAVPLPISPIPSPHPSRRSSPAHDLLCSTNPALPPSQSPATSPPPPPPPSSSSNVGSSAVSRLASQFEQKAISSSHQPHQSQTTPSNSQPSLASTTADSTLEDVVLDSSTPSIRLVRGERAERVEIDDGAGGGEPTVEQVDLNGIGAGMEDVNLEAGAGEKKTSGH